MACANTIRQPIAVGIAVAIVSSISEQLAWCFNTMKRTAIPGRVASLTEAVLTPITTLKARSSNTTTATATIGFVAS